MVLAMITIMMMKLSTLVNLQEEVMIACNTLFSSKVP